MQTRLLRSSRDRMFAGVCGGLAEYFAIDPVIVRLIFALVFFTSGLSLPIYLVLWLIMPLRPAEVRPAPLTPRFDPQTGQPVAVEQPVTGATVQLRESAPAWSGSTDAAAAGTTGPASAAAGQGNWQWLGIVLIGAGIVLVMQLIGISPTYLFAGVLIGAGVMLLRRR
jgi:phage shock protein C